MVDDGVVPAEVGIFVHQSVQAVWAGSGDAPGLDFVQNFNVRCGQCKEDVFLAGSPRGVAGALFIFTQYSIIDAGGL